AGMRDRLWRAAVPPRMLVPDVPPWLQEIILRAIEPQAAERYQTAAHVAFDLRHPEQVPLTQRAERTAGVGFAGQLRRWWRARRTIEPLSPRAPAAAARAPVILVAVDTEHPDDER